MKTVSVKFRGITKQGKIIIIENYVCKITYNNMNAFLSSYVLLNRNCNKLDLNKDKIKLEIELPEFYNKFFEYIELHFGLCPKKYVEKVIRNEIKSRNLDLNLL